MQTFNQNVLDPAGIRDLDNVHYESYQDPDAIVDEGDMEICDDEEKEEDDEDDDDDDDEELEYIPEEEIDPRVWGLQDGVEEEEEGEEDDEDESEEDEIVE